MAILAAVLYGELLGPKSIIALAFGIFGLILIGVSIFEPMFSARRDATRLAKQMHSLHGSAGLSFFGG